MFSFVKELETPNFCIMYTFLEEALGTKLFDFCFFKIIGN